LADFGVDEVPVVHVGILADRSMLNGDMLRCLID
jgi:hypothetical protein